MKTRIKSPRVTAGKGKLHRMKYYDLKKNWNKVKPHLGDKELNKILVDDFDMYNLQYRGEPFTAGMLPREIDWRRWRHDGAGCRPVRPGDRFQDTGIMSAKVPAIGSSTSLYVSPRSSSQTSRGASSIPTSIRQSGMAARRSSISITKHSPSTPINASKRRPKGNSRN